MDVFWSPPSPRLPQREASSGHLLVNFSDRWERSVVSLSSQESLCVSSAVGMCLGRGRAARQVQGFTSGPVFAPGLLPHWADSLCTSELALLREAFLTNPSGREHSHRVSQNNSWSLACLLFTSQKETPTDDSSQSWVFFVLLLLLFAFERGSCVSQAGL